MALRSIADTLDDIAEPFRGEYKEVDGKYVLDIENVDAHPTVRGLRSTLERLKTDKKDLTTKVSNLEARIDGLPDDFNVEKFEELKALADKNAKPEEHLAQLRTQLETKHGKEKSDLQKKIDALEGNIKRLVVDDGLTKALMDAGVSKEFMSAAKALLKEKGIVKLEEDEGTYAAIVDTDLGKLPLSKFVAEWATGDEGKVFVSKATGGGAAGGQGGKPSENNPWKKGEHHSLTAQGVILKTDRVKAEKFMKEAGLTEAAINTVLKRD
jgi:archaellum component FlaC